MSSASSSSSSDSEDDYDEAVLNDLLEQARTKARAAKGKARQVDFGAGDDVVLLDDEEFVADVQIERPRPSVASAKDVQPKSKVVLLKDNFGQLPTKRLSKKAYRATLPKTAGSKWFDMPAAPTAPSNELKREVAALKLSGVIDRKRFLKGEARKGAGKMPEFFQVGLVSIYDWLC